MAARGPGGEQLHRLPRRARLHESPERYAPRPPDPHWHARRTARQGEADAIERDFDGLLRGEHHVHASDVCGPGPVALDQHSGRRRDAAFPRCRQLEPIPSLAFGWQNRRANPNVFAAPRAHQILGPRSGSRIDGPQRSGDRGIGKERQRRRGEQERESHGEKPGTLAPALQCDLWRSDHRSAGDYDASVIRLAYLCAYALIAALGEALVARPASLWLRSQGIFHPALAWEVPYGSLLAASAAALALFTVWLASHAATGRRPVLPLHVAFLLLAGICLALRSASGEPRTPPDPAPALISALEAAATELDRSYTGLYAPDAAQFASSLAQVAPPPFRRVGRQLPLHPRILSAAEGAQLEPLPDDQPGTLYIAISQDRQSAWLTALSLNGILALPSGSPAIAEAHAGTHSAPGTDPKIPSYTPVRSGK